MTRRGRRGQCTKERRRLGLIWQELGRTRRSRLELSKKERRRPGSI